MIDQPASLQPHHDSYDMEAYEQKITDENISSINQMSTQLKNSSKKPNYDLQYIKHLKSKDIKLSHKKILPFSSKASPNLKHGSSFEYEPQAAPQDKSPQSKLNEFTQVAKLIKNKKSQNSQKLKQKQKPSEPQNSFNPETLMYSKQSLTLTRDKYNKKLKGPQLSSLQHRVRQSRSENKRQKINNNPNLNSVVRNNSKNSYQNQSNIFHNIDLFAKQNSHHSLDKNQQLIYAQEKFGGPMSSKIEQKLHLPSLVNNAGLKHAKSKIHQNINLASEHNETEMQKSHFYLETSAKTQKSTPYIQKIVKIPIERLKPLKPEEIKLKYQQKVKEEQKNRAKQRAIKIFEKDEEEAEKRKLMESKKSYEIESDENSELHQTENRRMENNEFAQLTNKKSLIKQEKLIQNRGENIFKKKLIAYNGQY